MIVDLSELIGGIVIIMLGAVALTSLCTDLLFRWHVARMERRTDLAWREVVRNLQRDPMFREVPEQNR